MQTQSLFRSRALAALGAAMALACSGNKEPEPLPSQTVAQVTPQLQPPPPLAPPPIREVAPTKRSTVKVIDAGGEADESLTLVEASQIAKARKAESAEPVAKITDENLREYSEGAEVIILESEPAAPGPELDPFPETEAVAGSQDVRGEDYWRTRALELRMGWRRTVDRIQELAHGGLSQVARDRLQEALQEEDVALQDPAPFQAGTQRLVAAPHRHWLTPGLQAAA